MKGKSIGIIALKGGVGKTSVTSNLGTVLARDFGKKVILIDANFSTPHLGLSLGLVNPRVSLQDVLNEKASIYEAINAHSLGFHIIGGKANNEKINPYKLKEKVDDLKKFYDVILIDSSPSLNEEILSTMTASDKLIAVSTPDYLTLASTIHAVKIAKENQTPIEGIIINKVRNKKFEIVPSEISSSSGVPVISTLKEDVKILKALSECTPRVSYSSRSKSSRDYRKIASNLIGEPDKRKTILKYLKGIPSNIRWRLKNKKDLIKNRRR